MHTLAPAPGAAMTFEHARRGRRLVFVNAFAANDPESSERLWDLARARHGDLSYTVALFNCRADRVDRSRQLGAAVARWEAYTGETAERLAAAPATVGAEDSDAQST